MNGKHGCQILCSKLIYFIRVLRTWIMHPFETAMVFCSVQECMSAGFRSKQFRRSVHFLCPQMSS